MNIARRSLIIALACVLAIAACGNPDAEAEQLSSELVSQAQSLIPPDDASHEMILASIDSLFELGPQVEQQEEALMRADGSSELYDISIGAVETALAEARSMARASYSRMVADAEESSDDPAAQIEALQAVIGQVESEAAGHAVWPADSDKDAFVSTIEAKVAGLEDELVPAWQTAYAEILDVADSFEFNGYGAITGYRYALAEMNGDDTPELLLLADFAQGARGAGESWARVFWYDEDRKQAAFAKGEGGIDAQLQWGAAMGLGGASDGNGLIVGYADMTGIYSSRVTLVDGRLYFDDPGDATSVDLDLHDISDRSALGGEAAAAAPAPTPAPSPAADFECDYFTVDVPDSWGDNWSVYDLGNDTWQFSQSATAGGAATVTVTGGSAAHTSVAGTTSGGLTVYLNEAAGGFFGDGMATITLK